MICRYFNNFVHFVSNILTSARQGFPGTVLTVGDFLLIAPEMYRHQTYMCMYIRGVHNVVKIFAENILGISTCARVAMVALVTDCGFYGNPINTVSVLEQ